MELSQLTSLMTRTILLVIALSFPPIIVASVVGVVVSLVQALTQVQEQTVSFALKLIAVIFTTFLISGWMGEQMMNFSLYLFDQFPIIVQ
ncbi:MAG: type III secretion system export apparatus subunit SctS [Nitrospirae bacterium]|nr:type III secretion system export apparatus subunit SctS [Nitrospirota bacterium]